MSALVSESHRAARWGAFVAATQEARETIAAPLVDLAEADRVSHADLPRALRRAFWFAWLARCVEARPALARFQALTHEQRVREFRDLDRRVLADNRSRLVASLRARVQTSLRDRSRRGGDAGAAARDGEATQSPADPRDAAAGRARRARHQARVPDEPAVGRAVHEGRHADLRPRRVRRGVAAAAGGCDRLHRARRAARGRRRPEAVAADEFLREPARGALGDRQRGRRRRPRRREHPRSVHGLRRAHEPAEVALPQRARVIDLVLERQFLRRRPADFPQCRTAVRSPWAFASST